MMAAWFVVAIVILVLWNICLQIQVGKIIIGANRELQRYADAIIANDKACRDRYRKLSNQQHTHSQGLKSHAQAITTMSELFAQERKR